MSGSTHDSVADTRDHRAARVGAPAAGFGAWALVAFMVSAVSLGIEWLRAGETLPAPRVAPPVHRVDLLHAGVDEIALLPEIGPRLAAAIVADREANGAYGSVDDLLRVRGIGPAKLALLAEYARVGDDAEAREAP